MTASSRPLAESTVRTACTAPSLARRKRTLVAVAEAGSRTALVSTSIWRVTGTAVAPSPGVTWPVVSAWLTSMSRGTTEPDATWASAVPTSAVPNTRAEARTDPARVATL